MKILIVESRFYEHITDNLAQGAIGALTDAGASYDRLVVPGILEIPAAVRYVVQAMEMRSIDARYDGFVTLGCAIKGETNHYDHVSHEAFRGLQDLVLTHDLAMGNGILTVMNEAQAIERCLPERRNFGGQAGRACLRMIAIKKELGLIAK